jgi:flagellin-like hook-associated protein FlgL
MLKSVIVAACLLTLPLSAATITLTQNTVIEIRQDFNEPIRVISDDFDLNGFSLTITTKGPTISTGGAVDFAGRIYGTGSVLIGAYRSVVTISGHIDNIGPVTLYGDSVVLKSANHFRGKLTLVESGWPRPPGSVSVEAEGAIPAGNALDVHTRLSMGPYSLDVTELSGGPNSLDLRESIHMNGGMLTVRGTAGDWRGFMSGSCALNASGNIGIDGSAPWGASLGCGDTPATINGTLRLLNAGISNRGPITVSGRVRSSNGSFAGPTSFGSAALEIKTDAVPFRATAFGDALTFTSASRLEIAAGIWSSAPWGFGFPLVVTYSTVTLGNCTLDFKPSPQADNGNYSRYILISNESGQPINGTFAGLPEGATFTVDGGLYRISYQGNINGRDVVISTLKSATQTTLTSTPNPSRPGDNVALRAVAINVRPPNGLVLVGNVIFRDGGNELATVPLDSTGVATFFTHQLLPGTHTLTAEYTGSATQNTSTSAPVTHIAKLPPPVFRTSIHSSRNPAVAGATVTLTASVDSDQGTAEGSVDFVEGSAILATIGVNGGVATFPTTFTAGTHKIYAIFNPSGEGAATSSAPLTQHVDGVGSTRTTVGAYPNPAPPGQPVQLTALVRAAVGTATGVVTFFDGSIAIEHDRLDVTGRALVTIQGLAAGRHEITARYEGASGFTESVSPPLSLMLDSALCNAPAIVAAPQDALVVRGGSATLTITTTGDEPQHIEWFRGSYPDDDTLLGEGASLALIHIDETTVVWVRVTNACGFTYAAARVTPAEGRRRPVR